MQMIPPGLLRRSVATGVRHRLRHFSGDASPDPTRSTVHFVGDDRYGSRQYVLLPDDASLDDLKANPKLMLAAIHAHRNVVFGASVHTGGDMIDCCGPLLDAALVDASEPGEQPQALASLAGLCTWVTRGITGEEENKTLVETLESDETAYEAVKAIATGVPRPGHSVVGVGTYRDGKSGWEALAKEFIQLEKCDEARLYQSRGGELVAIEHLADQSEAYLRSAGGAMARFFFVS